METSYSTMELAQPNGNKLQHNGISIPPQKQATTQRKFAQHSGNKMQYNKISTTQWKPDAIQ